MKHLFLATIIFGFIALWGAATALAQENDGYCTEPSPGADWCTPVQYEGEDEPREYYFPIEVGGDGEAECRDFCANRESSSCIANGCREISDNRDHLFCQQYANFCKFDNITNPFQNLEESCREKTFETDMEGFQGSYPCAPINVGRFGPDKTACGVNPAVHECGSLCYGIVDGITRWSGGSECFPTNSQCITDAEGQDMTKVSNPYCGRANNESDADPVGFFGQGVNSVFTLNGFKPFENVEGLYDGDEGGANSLPHFINTFLGFIIGISGAAVVVMIVVGGFRYVMSSISTVKTKAAADIRNSLIGLGLLLVSVALLNTLNPQLLNLEALRDIEVTISTPEFVGGNSPFGTGGTVQNSDGQCTANGTEGTPCDPDTIAQLNVFPANESEMAAAVCKLESNANMNLASGVDKCKDGNAFSFGLFQINIIAHYDKLQCANDINEIFEINGDGTQGTCLERNNGTCIKYDCRVTDQAKYNACKGRVTQLATHMQVAGQIYDEANGWSPWGAWQQHCRQ